MSKLTNPLRIGNGVLLPFAVAILLLIIGALLIPQFMSVQHVSNMVDGAIFLGMLAVGQTFTMLTGGIDLSLPYMINVSAVLLAGYTMGANNKLPEAMVLVLGFGLVFGAVNGIGIALFRVPALVMTLAMNSVLEGIAYLYTGGTPFGSAPGAISRLANGYIGPVPIGVLVWAVLAALTIVTLRKTSLGRRIYAIGAASRAATLSGVSVASTTIIVYAISGLIGAFVGVMLTGYAGQPYMGMGDSYLLASVAVVVIGGTSIYGGIGGYVGSIAGTLIIAILTDMLTLLNVGQNVQDILYGAIIVLMLGLNRVTGKATRSA